MSTPTPLRAERTEPEGTGISPYAVMTLALRAFNQRVLLWLVTGGACAGWTLTILHPDPTRLIAAATYSATVLWPFLWHDLKWRE